MNVFVDPYDLKRALRDGLRINGVVDEAPTDGKIYGRSNGAWVEIPFQLSVTYYWQDTASGIATYFKQLGTPFSPKTTMSSAALAAGNHLLDNFVTDPGIPNFSFIPAGPYAVHVHTAKTSGTKSANVFAEIWECDAAGADIVKIGTTESTPALTATEQEFEIVYVNPNTHTLASVNSRIVTRVFVTIGSSGANPVVALFVGGLADSHITFPAPNP